ncbi:MAG: carbonic anhydrase [Kordia sp.]|uniref:carbonic anhydrase n=1 Tax=Kordia sp. TaxID=1965332 RepID=UPI00385CE25B
MSENCKGNFKDRSDFKKITKRLDAGNKRFIDVKSIHPNVGRERRKCTAENGQKPYAIVLSCADSRVPPELIFDTGIGDLFVVRIAGNIANTSAIASIEFAVAVLGCQYILVLGHESCGAVQAAIDGGEPASPSLEHLVNHIKPAVKACGCCSDDDEIVKSDWKTLEESCNFESAPKKSTAKAKRLKRVTIENAHHSASELLHHSEILRRSFLSNNLAIHTGYYNLASGKVDFDLPSQC